jgi:hypothetical protein
MNNNFAAHLDNPSHPFLTCDNWFTPEEEQMVWKELDLYTSERTLDHASNGPVATDAEGEVLASNFRIYPDMIYNDRFRNMSPILRGMEEKLTTQEIKDFISKNMLPGPFGQFAYCNSDSTLISYYHKGDYYKPHLDTFQFTILIWFYKEPKAFTGGDFHFTDAKISVPCVHNRLIIFPSFLNHAVTPLEFEEEKPLGWGRYTITHFFYSVANTGYTPLSERKDNG